MKKVLAIALALAMVVALAACGNKTTTDADNLAVEQPPVGQNAESTTNEDSTAVPENAENADNADGADDSGVSAGVEPGKYIYQENDFITWEVLLMENGSCTLNEIMRDEPTEYVTEGWTDLGNGYFQTGAWEDSSAEKSDFFAPNGINTWKVTGDGTCEPADESEVNSSDSNAVAPGKYLYTTDEYVWEIMIMGNGNCRVDQYAADTYNTGSDAVEALKSHTTTDGWTDNGDGTFDTGAWEEAEQGDGYPSDLTAPNGITTWKVTGDGLCEPTEKVEAVEVSYGKYTYKDEDSGETWAVLIMGNGNCSMQLLDDQGEVVEEHVCKGFRINDDGTFTNYTWDDEQEGYDAEKIPAFCTGQYGMCTWKIVDAENFIVIAVETT